MGHLVQDGFGSALIEIVGDAGPEDVVLQEGHRPGILHRARIELRNEELIVLAEGVRDAEVLVVERESLLGLGEQPVGVHELRQRGPAVDPQGDGAVLVGVGVGPFGVGTGDQGHEVGAHRRVSRKRCTPGSAATVLTTGALEITFQSVGAVTVSV